MHRLIIFLLLIQVAAASEPLYYYDSLTINGVLKNPITVQAAGSSPSIKDLTTIVTWVPETDERQSIISFETTPSANIDDGNAIFTIPAPIIGQQSFDVEYNIKAFADSHPVTEKISFPPKQIPLEYAKFTEATDIIDVTSEISSLAGQLVAGEDDMYKAVVALADWTKSNIEYNLSTINVEASQSSSWVLRNRQGVCDEMTNLFISFLRSLGIPARFVSGLSYTTSELFDENWGAHGWAEVYFPDVGWVPFDVTYGQLGWVDATHIKFSDGVDSDKYATSFEWKGKDIVVKPEGLELEAEVVEKGNTLSSLLELDISMVEEVVGIQSHNVIAVEVANPTDKYVADELVLGLTESVSILDYPRKVVALAPGEVETFYWRVKVGELDPNYQYTFPMSVVSQRNATASTFFSSIRTGSIFSEEWANAYVSSEGVTVTDVVFSCETQTEQPRPGEQFLVACTADEQVEVCYEDECKETSDGVVEFSTSFEEPAVYSLAFTGKFTEAEVLSLVTINVVDEAKVTIESISAPESIDYASEGTIHFEVVQQSAASARLVEISITGPRISQEWEFDELEGRKVFDIVVPGRGLTGDINEIEIKAKYYDDRANAYEVVETTTINLGEITFLERIELFFVNLLGI